MRNKATFRASRRRNSVRVTLLGLIIATTLAVLGAMQSATADGQLNAGNQNCVDLIPGSLELRINAPADGPFSNPDGFSVTVDVRTLTSDDPAHPGNQRDSQVFDFTATGGTVTGVAVKGGPDTNFYDYRPGGVNSGTGLHAPVNDNKKFYGLSHISFCYVLLASPTIVTVASPDITIGGTIHDVATLSGGNGPTGTITFRLYGPNDATCSGTAIFTDTAAVLGNDQYASDPYTPTSVGTYRWIASYGGDANNSPATGACNDADENVVVSAVPSSMTTAQDWVPNDSATISAPAGSGNLAGSAFFTLYPSSDCTGTPVYTSGAVAVAGASPQTRSTSNTTAVSTSGSFSWSVSYDSTNAAQEDIPASCHETSALTITNGGTVSSP